MQEEYEEQNASKHCMFSKNCCQWMGEGETPFQIPIEDVGDLQPCIIRAPCKWIFWVHHLNSITSSAFTKQLTHQ